MHGALLFERILPCIIQNVDEVISESKNDCISEVHCHTGKRLPQRTRERVQPHFLLSVFSGSGGLLMIGLFVCCLLTWDHLRPIFVVVVWEFFFLIQGGIFQESKLKTEISIKSRKVKGERQWRRWGSDVKKHGGDSPIGEIYKLL